MSALTNNPPTMSSREIAELTGKRHPDVKRDIEIMMRDLAEDVSSFARIYLDSMNREQTEYALNRELTDTLLTGYSAVLRRKVIARWRELEAGTDPQHARRPLGVDPALSAFRTSRAIASSTKTAESICARFPTLGASAQQTIYAKLVNAAAGQDVVPLPIVENLLSATAVGKIYGISANAVGKLANAHGLKVAQYGEFAMDKSQHSEKQMPSFRYNAAGVARIGELIGGAA